MDKIFIDSQNGTVHVPFTLAKSAWVALSAFSEDGTYVTYLDEVKWYEKGQHTFTWNKLDFLGNPVPNGVYDIEIITHNVTSTWDVPCNNSTFDSGPGVYQGFGFTQDICIVGNRKYFVIGYNESQGSLMYCELDTPHIRHNAFSEKIGLYRICSDEQKIYAYANGLTKVHGQERNNYFVIAFNLDHSLYAGSAGKKIAFSEGFSGTYSAMDLRYGIVDEAEITVQKNGNYFFISHPEESKVKIYNKLTFAFVSELNLSGARKLIAQNHILFVSTSTGIQRFSISLEGIATATGGQIPFTNIVGLSINSHGHLVVAQAGTIQQLKTLDDSGNTIHTHGQFGGYSSNRSAAFDKFLFGNNAAVTYKENGDYFVLNSGSNQITLFSEAHNYLDHIMWFGRLRAGGMNGRFRYVEYLKFEMDDSKPRNARGYCTLIANFRPDIGTYASEYVCMFCMVTLSNGRTYGLRRNNTNNRFEMFEETITGLRKTRHGWNKDAQLTKKGVYYREGSGLPGTLWQDMFMAVSGFYPDGDPILAIATPAISITRTGFDPVEDGDGGSLGEEMGEDLFFTESSSVGVSEAESRGAKVGVYSRKQNRFLAQTCWVQGPAYMGPVKNDGRFLNGRLVNHARGMGRAVNIPGTGWIIIKQIANEFLDGSDQSNYQFLFYQSGTFLQTLGTDGVKTKGQPNPAEMAGNNFSNWAEAILINGEWCIVVWGVDESIHGGPGRRIIRGFNTVKITRIPLTIGNMATTSSQSSGEQTIDMMEGLPPIGESMPATAGRWVRNPTQEGPNANGYLYVQCGRWNYEVPSFGVAFLGTVPGTTATVACDFSQDNLTNLSNWRLSIGEISWQADPSARADDGGGNGLLGNLCDDAGKVIVRIDYEFRNNQPVVSFNRKIAYIDDSRQKVRIGQPVELIRIGNQIKCIYSGSKPVVVNRYDPAASMNNIGKYEIFCSYGGGVSREHQTSIAKAILQYTKE